MTIIRNLLTLARMPKFRKKRNWDEVPTLLLFIIAFLCWSEASFYTYVVTRFGPDYLELANEPGAMANLRFLCIGAILLVIAVQVFVWGMAAKKADRFARKSIVPGMIDQLDCPSPWQGGQVPQSDIDWFRFGGEFKPT